MASILYLLEYKIRFYVYRIGSFTWDKGQQIFCENTLHVAKSDGILIVLDHRCNRNMRRIISVQDYTSSAQKNAAQRGGEVRKKAAKSDENGKFFQFTARKTISLVWNFCLCKRKIPSSANNEFVNKSTSHRCIRKSENKIPTTAILYVGVCNVHGKELQFM